MNPSVFAVDRIGRTLVTVALLSLVTACGGGSPGSDSASALVATSETARSEQRAAVAVEAPAGAENAAIGQPAWTLCALEGQTCIVPGMRQFRYGTETQNVSSMQSDQVACSNSVFGDPAPWIVKSCWYSSQVADTPPNETWITCAGESQFCAFSGARVVRYGTTTQYFSGTYTNGVSCSNTVFGDPVYGTVKSCMVSATAIVADPVPAEPGTAAGQNPPIVFNASSSVQAGDVVSLQGVDFGTAPRVYLDGAPGAPLEIVNRVGTGWVAVQIPASAQGALVLRINNGTGTSARVPLNAARPYHLDALQLVPGGAFKVFGRSLLAGSSTPRVMVDGLPATVDVARSDAYMLVANAPTALRATSSAVVTVDNGNGTGPAPLDRTIEVVAPSAATDPFNLGVGWGAGFASIANTSIYADADPRLARKVACNGTTDDTPAIRAAIDLAASTGGGVVRLPAGRCRMVNGMELKSRVVVQGAGKGATELIYEANYPVYAVNVDLSGIGNLTLTNAGSASEGPLLKDSTRVFVQNLKVQLKTSRQMYLTGNRNFVVAGSDFIQGGSIAGQGPYVLHGNAGFVFSGNTTQWVDGAPSFVRIHDAHIHGNRFSRDARPQQPGGTVHSFVMDFAHRIAVVGNTFDVVGGPVTNKTRNDGEAILTEGGGSQRTENLGTVGSATATSVSDPSNAFRLDPFGLGSTPENYGIAIVGGKGEGQTRRVIGASGSRLDVDRAWQVVPDGTSRYATFVWGLEKSLIKDNRLSQNPRGLWLYHTAVRDVDVVGNEFTEGGGIYLRAFQNLSTKSFMPLYNVRIVKNRVTNTTGQWLSYINAVFVNSDARAFGIAMLGIEIHSNEITANRTNLSSTWEEYAGTEGFVNMMRVENYAGYETSIVPRVLGSIVANNVCTYCEVAVRIGTGAGGTTILNTRLVQSGAGMTDWATTSTREQATDTINR